MTHPKRKPRKYKPKPVECRWCRVEIDFRTGACACPDAEFRPKQQQRKAAK